MRTDMVQAVLASHPHLESLGLMYEHFPFFSRTYSSTTFLEDGISTPSACLLSATFANSHLGQKTTMVTPTWVKSALC